MPRRPILGRAGAGVLITALALLASLAIPRSTVATVVTHPAAANHADLDARSSQASVNRVLTAAVLPAASSQAPAVEEVQVVPTGRSAIRVPIVMYHYIRVNPNPRDQLGFNLSVTPDDFRRQMDLLRDRGYHPIDFDDLRAYWAGQHALPARPVVLTFDDGYADFYTTAYPILSQHRFKAVSYVVPGFLNGPNYMSTPQIQELDTQGIQIASHTVGHVDLTKASAGQLTYQLVESRRALEQMVGHPVLDFCYPSGMYNATVTAAVQAAGYQSATTTQPGLSHSLADRFVWARQRVSGGESLERFALDLGAEEPTVTVTRPVPLSPAGTLAHLASVFPLAAPPAPAARPPLPLFP